MPAHFHGLGIGDLFERRQDGELDPQVLELGRLDRGETRVLRGRKGRRPDDGLAERRRRLGEADAASELAPLLEGHEHAAPGQEFGVARAVLDDLPPSDERGDRRTGQPEELGFVVVREQERAGPGRGVGEDGRGEISDHGAAEAGRVRPVQDLDPRPAGLFRQEKGGDDGTSAAHDVVPGLGLPDQGLGVERPDEGNGRGISRVGLLLGQEMGKVGRRDDQDVPAPDRFIERVGQSFDGLPGLGAHDDGHDRGPGERPLDEGDLDFDRVLLGECLGNETEAGGLHDRPGQVLVDAGGPEGRFETAVRPDRAAAEAHLVRRPDDDHGLDGPLPGKGVGGSGRQARIEVTGMRRDQGDELALGRRRGGRPGQGVVDHRGQPGRVLFVELAGEGSPLDVLGREGEARRHADGRQDTQGFFHGCGLSLLRRPSVFTIAAPRTKCNAVDFFLALDRMMCGRLR